MKEIKTWRDREREKVFPRNEVRGSALDSLFVVVVVAIISILTRPSPREKKVPLAVDGWLLVLRGYKMDDNDTEVFCGDKTKF